MKPDDCLEVGACARQLERHRAAKAIADCRDSTRVNLLLGQEHIETCSSQGTSEVRVRHQGGEAGDSLVSERRLALALALALVVKRATPDFPTMQSSARHSAPTSSGAPGWPSRTPRPTPGPRRACRCRIGTGTLPSGLPDPGYPHSLRQARKQRQWRSPGRTSR